MKMNAAVNSPIEALAVNYLAYGFLAALNNIWAWIAVKTAALSFWKMRALPSSSSSTPELIATRNPASKEPITASTTSETPVSAAPPCGGVLERQGNVKMKFSLYYEEEEGGQNEESCFGEAVMSRESDDWERMMTVRMGDMGWYRWQDRMVLDGSVVRLWGRRHAAAQVVV